MEKLISVLQSPQSIAEFVELFGAYLSARMLSQAETLLDKAKDFGVDTSTCESLRSKLNLQRLLGSN
jgi:hypothetical protein